MSLANILKKATIVAAGLGAFLAADKVYAQTTWNTRGLTHEQIKDIMDGNGRNDASPGDTIKFNVASYTFPPENDPFIGRIDNLTIIGNDNTMDGTVIQNDPNIGWSNGLVFDVRATGWTIKNMTIENIQSGIKAGELPQGKIMRLRVENVLIKDTDFPVSYDAAQDGDGDKNRQGTENVILNSSVLRDSNVAMHQNRVDERTDSLRYGVLTNNTIINCNLGFDATWYCTDGQYPCDCDDIYVPGVGRNDGNTFDGQNEGQSLTEQFRCGNGRGLLPEDTADDTIEFLVTNPTLYELGIGINNIEADPQESFWGYVAHRGSPRIGTDGKTINRGGRKNYFADADRDGDVDMKDIQMFQNYFSGNSTYTINDRAKFTWADYDGDERITTADYSTIVPAITGPEIND